MKKNEYQCSLCHGIFVKGKSDKEAMEEYNFYFPFSTADERCIVCDDCFNKIHPKDHPIFWHL